MNEIELLRKEIDALRAEVASLRDRLDNGQGVDPDTVAIIAAALAAHFGHTVRIRKIRRVADPDQMGWRRQGRVAIQGSHAIR